MRTVLVTGGCGFIGSHFITQLLKQESWRVVNFDKLTYAGDPARLSDIRGGDRYRFVRGDIADPAQVNELLGDERPCTIVNFAAESHVDRSILDSAPFMRTNVVGTQVLLDAAKSYNVERFLQISTDEVYGDANQRDPFSEDSPLRPSSPYSASKAAADLLCLAYKRTHGTPIMIARSSNNYGPFQFPEKLIPLTIRNALMRRPLPVYGDGTHVRDWLHVEDNCTALIAISERGQVGRIYNIGADQYHTNLDVVRMTCQVIAEETGSSVHELEDLIRFVPDRPGHDRRYATNTVRIREELGWPSPTPFNEGLGTVVRWYLEHQDWTARVTSGDFQRYYEAVYLRQWQPPPL